MLALVSSAAIFDMCHQPTLLPGRTTQKLPVKKDGETNKLVFYNPVTSYNLKITGSECWPRMRFSCMQDKFLLKYYNQCTFQLMKTEASLSLIPSICLFHVLPFNRQIYFSPDDTPPLLS
jgi:hypothetical protein